MKIAIAGTGYVGLSNAVLLSQKHEVTAVDVVESKVRLINEKKSPIAAGKSKNYSLLLRQKITWLPVFCVKYSCLKPT